MNCEDFRIERRTIIMSLDCLALSYNPKRDIEVLKTVPYFSKNFSITRLKSSRGKGFFNTAHRELCRTSFFNHS